MPEPPSKNLPSALARAYLENKRLLARYLRSLLGTEEDADDVSQEAFLRAYVAEQKQAIRNPKAYLFSAARNIALTRLTHKSAQIMGYIEELSASDVSEGDATVNHSATVLQEVEAEEMLGLYCQVIASLPEKCREVVLLRKVHGLPHKEIAARLSLSVSSVEKYLRIGLIACEEFMEAYEGSPSRTTKEAALAQSRRRRP